MSANPMNIAYNTELKALSEVFTKVNRPGNFYAEGRLLGFMPRLIIDGREPISFPLPASQAKEIKQQASQAPYGRGEDTLVDTSVRNVWQVPLDKIEITGQGWEQTLETILSRVAHDLGRNGVPMKAELYKLLLYETGGFFLSHRDTEKAEGMFGTLVVVLPSLHQGGELIVRHGGKEVVLELSTRDSSEMAYGAFYADCQHEVRPISSGNRLCLIYNLIQPNLKADKAPDALLSAPNYQTEIDQVVQILDSWGKEKIRPPKLIYLLEHQYTPAGLQFGHLKNLDSALANVLLEGAKRAGFVVHLGIVHIEESGSAEPAYDTYRGRGRRRYDDHDDDDEEEEEMNSEDFEVIDVCDERQFVSDWVDTENRAVKLGEIPIEEGEILPEGALDDEPPDEQRLTEATGNEGTSYERSYHRAALVLWKTEDHLEVVLQGGMSGAILYLKTCLQQWNKTHDSNAKSRILSSLTSSCQKVVREWNEGPAYYGRAKEQPLRAEMLNTLLQCCRPELAEEFIEATILANYDGSENLILAQSLGLLGEEALAKSVGRIFESWVSLHPDSCVHLLSLLIGNLTQESGRYIASAFIGQLEMRKGNSIHSWISEAEQNERRGCRVTPGFVSTLIQSLLRLRESDLIEQALVIITKEVDLYSPDKTLTEAFLLLHDSDAGLLTRHAALAALWNHTVEFLLKRSEFTPIHPVDWQQEITIECACSDCQELQKFSRDPQAKVYRFRVRKDRRMHLHQTIEIMKMDIDHVTERQGSPQTLVCTKNRNSFARRTDDYQKDIGKLLKLLKIVPPEFQGLEPLIARVEEAEKRFREQAS